MSEEQLTDLDNRVAEAKTNREKFYEFIAVCAQIGAGIAKAMA